MIFIRKMIKPLSVCPAVILICFCFQVKQVYSQTLVVTTTDSPQTTSEAPLPEAEIAETEAENAPEKEKPLAPDVYSLKVRSDIIYRYATTLVTSRVANPDSKAREVTFRVAIPETAFINRFIMEIKGNVYEAYVKEKEAAKQIYDQAVHQGLTAAHVAYNPRDSNAFTVSVNVEKHGKVTFNLTYEELLNRRLNSYEHVINVDPGQIVPDMSVEVNIVDSNNITNLEVPNFKTGNEISSSPTDSGNSWADIERPSPKEARVRFVVTPEQQKEVGGVSGLAGQLAVRYDVERDQKEGEVVVVDGYFVHFFAPEGLTPLKKHVVFILDTSGSMYGTKIKQLREAMDSILGELQDGDYFNIIDFNSGVYVWNPAHNESARPNDYYTYTDPSAPSTTSTPEVIEIYPASSENIVKAQEYINRTVASGGTNIHDAVKKGIELASESRRRNAQSTETDLPEPIIIFLTDGEPTVGVTGLEEIQAAISEANAQHQVAIFSLAFGQGADFRFLRRLSLANRGFARRIYEDSDAVLQLKDFYKQVASPLLANITFKYDDTKVDWGSITKRVFPTFFAGSELVVAGKIASDSSSDFSGSVNAVSSNGSLAYQINRPPIMDYPCYLPLAEVSSGDEAVRERRSIIGQPCLPPFPLPPRNVTHNFGFLERLWAYLTIQQLLEEYDASGAKDAAATNALDDSSVTTTSVSPTEIDGEEAVVPPKPKTPREKALELALKYSFVTPVTSLVVVKPETENTTETGLSSSSDPSSGRPSGGALSFASIGGPPPGAFSQGVSGFGGFAALAAPGPMNSFQSGGFAGSALPPSAHRPVYHTTPFLLADIHTPESALEELSTTVPSRVGLSDVQWLNNVHNGTGLLLPVGPNNTDMVVPFDENQINVQGGECVVPFTNSTGFCRPLVHCVQSNFTQDFNTFLSYYCNIEGYVGVCCPEPTLDGESETTGSPDTTIPSVSVSVEDSSNASISHLNSAVSEPSVEATTTTSTT